MPLAEAHGTACVALVVFAEARGESEFGQALVARTVANRALAVDRFADLCAIALAPNQFEGLDRWPYPREPWKIDPKAWAISSSIAARVLTGEYFIKPSLCAVSTHFVHESVRPSWTRTLKPTCRVGAHQFYVDLKLYGAK